MEVVSVLKKAVLIFFNFQLLLYVLFPCTVTIKNIVRFENLKILRNER